MRTGLSQDSIRFGDREVKLVKVREAKGGPVVSFPIDRTGVHITYHPGEKPHLREGYGKGGNPGHGGTSVGNKAATVAP